MNRQEIRRVVLEALERETGWPHEYDEDGLPVPKVTPQYRDHVLDGVAAELGINLEAQS